MGVSVDTEHLLHTLIQIRGEIELGHRKKTTLNIPKTPGKIETTLS